MKFILLFLAGIAALHSCTYDVGVEPVNKYTVDIGAYELLDESIEMLPYQGQTGAIFQDSIGNELLISVNESDLRTAHGRIFHYDVYNPGDTVIYNYTTQYKLVYLKNDSLNLTLNIGLQASPSYSDPSNNILADVLTILCRTQYDPSIFNQVFYHVLNQRTWPSALLSAVNIGSLTIFNKEFDDVLLSEFTIKSKVYFNYDVGIVSFTDHSDKQWRFDRFQ